MCQMLWPVAERTSVNMIGGPVLLRGLQLSKGKGKNYKCETCLHRWRLTLPE